MVPLTREGNKNLKEALDNIPQGDTMSSTIPDEPYNCAIHSANCKNIKCPGRKLTKKISDTVEKAVIEHPQIMGFDPGKKEDAKFVESTPCDNGSSPWAEVLGVKYKEDFKLPPKLLEKPSNHYGDGSKMELIDLINAEGDLVTFAKWNAIKYILRHDRKNGKEDLEKAQVYLNWLKEQYQ